MAVDGLCVAGGTEGVCCIVNCQETHARQGNTCACRSGDTIAHDQSGGEWRGYTTPGSGPPKLRGVARCHGAELEPPHVDVPREIQRAEKGQENEPATTATAVGSAKIAGPLCARRGHTSHDCSGGLDARAHDVVVRVLFRQAPAAGLAMRPQQQRLRVFGVEKLLHFRGPQGPRSPELCNLSNEAACGGRGVWHKASVLGCLPLAGPLALAHSDPLWA